MGGRIHLQYHPEDSDTGSAADTKTDELFFRRFRPYIEGSLHKDWMGKFEWDMGKAENDNEISIKDAYFRYKGFNTVTITVGNYTFPFSRETITSSNKRQTVEVSFTENHDYGPPEKNAGIHLNGYITKDKRVTWGLSAVSACIDPHNKKLDFDTPVNKNGDFNEGWIVGGRIDFHPLGELKFGQNQRGIELVSEKARHQTPTGLSNG